MKSEKRRKLLKSIAAGSGAVLAGRSLPESWSRPVVDSVMLPGHAQTSGRIYSGESIQVVSVDNQDGILLAGFLDPLVATAGAAEMSYTYTYCISLLSETIADVKVQIIRNDLPETYEYAGQLEVDVPGELPGKDVCEDTSKPAHPAKVGNVTDSSLSFTFDTTFTVPFAGTCVTFPSMNCPAG